MPTLPRAARPGWAGAPSDILAPPFRVAGVEFGGSKVLVAAGDGAAMAGAPWKIATTSPTDTLNAVVVRLKALEAEGPAFEAIGVAAFGPIQLDPAAADYGRLLNTPKPGWSGADVLAPLRTAFKASIVLETDVNAAALAEEAHSGAGRRDHAYITVGTGLGVGLVVDGHPVHGAGHPEAGHILARPVKGDSFPGVCPAHGACVEGLISGPALAERLGHPLEQGEVGPEVWSLAGEYLAQLCMAVTLTAAPQRIVLGGGVGSRPPLLEAARAHLHRLLGGYLERYRERAAVDGFLVPAALEHSGLVGALGMAAVCAGQAPGAPV